MTDYRQIKPEVVGGNTEQPQTLSDVEKEMNETIEN